MSRQSSAGVVRVRRTVPALACVLIGGLAISSPVAARAGNPDATNCAGTQYQFGFTPGLVSTGVSGQQIPLVLSRQLPWDSGQTLPRSGPSAVGAAGLRRDGALGWVGLAPSPSNAGLLVAAAPSRAGAVAITDHIECVQLQVHSYDVATGVTTAARTYVATSRAGGKPPFAYSRQVGQLGARGDGQISVEWRQWTPGESPGLGTVSSFSWRGYEDTPGLYSGTLMLLDARTGNVINRREVKPSRGPGALAVISGKGKSGRWIVVAESRHVGNADEVLSRVEAWDGSHLAWSREVPLLVGAQDILDAAAGPLLVTQSDPASSAVQGQGTQATGAVHRLTALDRKTGKVLWTRTGTTPWPNFTVTSTGTIIANWTNGTTGSDDFVEAIDPLTGKSRWHLGGYNSKGSEDFTGDGEPDPWLGGHTYADGRTGVVHNLDSQAYTPDANTYPIADANGDGHADFLDVGGNGVSLVSLISGATGKALWTQPVVIPPGAAADGATGSIVYAEVTQSRSTHQHEVLVAHDTWGVVDAFDGVSGAPLWRTTYSDHSPA